MELYPDDTLVNLRYTYSLDKVSCVQDVWYVHIAFALLVIVSGLGCLLSRLSDKTKWMHVHFGRMYIICMLWCMATSLVIHNTGLPIAVLISVLWVIGGLTAGWLLIKVHQKHVERESSDMFGRALAAEPETLTAGVKLCGLAAVLRDMKREIADQKSLTTRILSYKAAHGALMFMSFINVFGRIFGVNLSGGFTCHTFPYWKQVDTPKFNGLNASTTPVPIHDANYSKMPWASGLGWWGLELSVGPLGAALVVGLMTAWFETRKPKLSVALLIGWMTAWLGSRNPKRLEKRGFLDGIRIPQPKDQRS